VHPGAVAEQAKELKAEGLAGVLFTGADVEGGREGCSGDDVGVHGPEGEQVELLGGAIEVFFIEVGDLVD